MPNLTSSSIPCHWRQPAYPPGTPVEFIDTRWNRRGLGTLITSYDLRSNEDGWPGPGNVHPRIKVKGRDKVLLGCECWWVPVAELRGKPK